jgi:3D-(3,5/4)-trihydroxycyclohexane-1,2-dione acylhydrolase (decyclizing)
MSQKTIRLTMAQAVARFLTMQKTEIDGEIVPIFGGVFAIFGHGNVAGVGEALHGIKDVLPTYRAQNEQGMAHAAIAYAKASFRRRFMACTTSIGPGALNMVTAAALAHVNRLPVLLLPGDVFANRLPDPVLQQMEDFGDGTATVNDCFKPVSRYFDRITRPEQIIPALRRAMAVLTDPAECGPVTLSLCQDVQAEAYDYPESFFEEKVWSIRRVMPDANEFAAAATALLQAKKPVIIAGGGVLYSEASQALRSFAERYGVPVLETQAGKSSLPHDHKLNMGSVGVTGTSASNTLAEEADVVLAIGTRLQDFTTGSWALFKNDDLKIVGLNVQPFDAHKHRALPLVADARRTRGPQPGIDRLAGRYGLDRQGLRGQGAMADGCRQGHRHHQCRTPLRRPGHRRRAACPRECHAGLRRGRPAGGIAQAVEGSRAGQLPHGIWLLDHGLRDCGRARRQAGAAAG